jgi:hypothetical protein
VPTVITGRPDAEETHRPRDPQDRSPNPSAEDISITYVEHQHCAVHTTLRRDTRPSNGFSRKIESHMAAVAINYFAYNFIKIHCTLRGTPAMASGVTTRLFEVMDW